MNARFSTKVVAVAAASLVLGLVVPGVASATTVSGSKNCTSTTHVATKSKTAGYTSHAHHQGSTTYSNSWTVDPYDPTITFHGLQWQWATWDVYGAVLESASAVCATNPV